MKSIKLFMIIIVLIFYSCKEKNDSFIDIESIAQSPEYIQLKESQDSVMYFILYNRNIDFEAIQKIMNENPILDRTSYCEWDLNLFSNLENVEEFLKLNCKEEKMMNNLEKKYPFYKNLDSQMKKKIYSTYQENFGSEDLFKAKAEEFILQHNSIK